MECGTDFDSKRSGRKCLNQKVIVYKSYLIRYLASKSGWYILILVFSISTTPYWIAFAVGCCWFDHKIWSNLAGSFQSVIRINYAGFLLTGPTSVVHLFNVAFSHHLLACCFLNRLPALWSYISVFSSRSAWPQRITRLRNKVTEATYCPTHDWVLLFGTAAPRHGTHLHTHTPWRPLTDTRRHKQTDACDAHPGRTRRDLCQSNRTTQAEKRTALRARAPRQPAKFCQSTTLQQAGTGKIGPQADDLRQADNLGWILGRLARCTGLRSGNKLVTQMALSFVIRKHYILPWTVPIAMHTITKFGRDCTEARSSSYCTHLRV